ncbi:hypothetical protein ABIA73_004236, partial [Stenotrophomonas sp. 2694]
MPLRSPGMARRYRGCTAVVAPGPAPRGCPNKMGPAVAGAVPVYPGRGWPGGT